MVSCRDGLIILFIQWNLHALEENTFSAKWVEYMVSEEYNKEIVIYMKN